MSEVTMSLLEDIRTMLDSVSRDWLPARKVTCFVRKEPPGVILEVPEQTSEPLTTALYELAQGCQQVTERVLPSLPLRYTVIGGSLATGIVVEPEPGAEPIYGNIVKVKASHFRASNYLKERPGLLEELLKGNLA